MRLRNGTGRRFQASWLLLPPLPPSMPQLRVLLCALFAIAVTAHPSERNDGMEWEEMIETVATPKPVLAWAISGGGDLALAASMGFARALHQGQLTEKLSAISSVSGGTWFLSQYAFSEKFYEHVNSDTLSAVFEWFDSFYSLMKIRDHHHGGPDSVIDKDALNALKDVLQEGMGAEQSAALTQYLNAFLARDDLNWELFVTHFLDAYTSSFSDIDASSANRVFDGPDLLMCTNMITTGQMDDSDWGQALSAEVITGATQQTTLKVNGEKPPSPSYSSPAEQSIFPIAWKYCWKVHGSNVGDPAPVLIESTWPWSPAPPAPKPLGAFSGPYSVNGKDSWFTPQVPLNWFTVTQPSTLADKILGDKTTAPLQLPTPPKASKIAAMSSAAAGVGGAPDMLGNFKGMSTGSTIASVASSYITSDLAVCSGSVTGCKFPSVRLMDGAYSDNNAINLNVAHLQKKHPGAPLRIACLDSDPSTGEVLGLRGNGSALGYNFGAYDASHPRGYKDGFPSVDLQIFESVDYVEHAVTAVPSNLTYTTINAVTVQNDYFGVTAGTSVQLLVLNANGAYHGFSGTAMLTTAGTNDAANYANTAKHIYEALTSTSMLSKFFSTGSVEA